MPVQIEFGTDDYKFVATEEELLAFVNKARAAGGADVLEALLPSNPVNSETCLIANALNFGCSVDADEHEGKEVWFMYLPEGMEEERAEIIAEALECELFADERHFRTLYRVLLPEEIGNAAHAFDDRLAFQEYIK